MPHLVLRGGPDLACIGSQLAAVEPAVVRWGRAVLKRREVWSRVGEAALLVEGVVVELSRPQHPVALVAGSGDTVTVRLWPTVAVERTPAVQRWLAWLAADLQGIGLGSVCSTNLADDLLEGLLLQR